MTTQLEVIKTDGTTERYLHTKVVGTFNNALATAGQPDIYVAEALAEAATYFLYHRKDHCSVTSGEIFSIVKAVLTATGYERAAAVLTDHCVQRKLNRCRTEVVHVDVQDLADTENICESPTTLWDKAAIVKDLMTEYGLPRQTARTVASIVEERVFSLGMTTIPSSLIKQIVLRDAAFVLHAQHRFCIYKPV